VVWKDHYLVKVSPMKLSGPPFCLPNARTNRPNSLRVFTLTFYKTQASARPPTRPPHARSLSICFLFLNCPVKIFMRVLKHLPPPGLGFFFREWCCIPPFLLKGCLRRASCIASLFPFLRPLRGAGRSCGRVHPSFPLGEYPVQACDWTFPLTPPALWNPNQP